MLRSRYGTTDSRVVLPVNTQPRRRRLLCKQLLLTLCVCACGTACLHFYTHYQTQHQQYVTISTPSSDTWLQPMKARPVRRDEIANGRVELLAMSTIIQQMRQTMQKHNLQCLTANAMGMPLRILIMAIEQEFVIS